MLPRKWDPLLTNHGNETTFEIGGTQLYANNTSLGTDGGVYDRKLEGNGGEPSPTNVQGRDAFGSQSSEPNS